MSKCIKCGKLAEEIYCRQCLIDETPLISGFKEGEIVSCPSCKRVFSAGKWHNITLPIAIEEKIRKSIVASSGAEIVSLKIDIPVPAEHLHERIQKELKKGFKVGVEIRGTLNVKAGRTEVKENYEFPVKVRLTQCSGCGKGNRDYFESTIQLRNPTQDAIEFLELEVARNLGRVRISKKERIEKGFDFYLTERRFALKIGRSIVEKFGGELKAAERLFSIDHSTGKALYRVNVLVRLPEFTLGDVLKIGNDVIKITGVGSRVSGLNLLTGKKQAFDCAKLNSKLKFEKLQVFTAVVSKSFPELEVIHPESFQSVKVRNPAMAATAGKTRKKEVRVVLVGENVWLVDNLAC